MEKDSLTKHPGKIEGLIKELLLELGEDPERDGLKKTPKRVERAYGYLTNGYRSDLKKLLNGAIFEHESDDMIIQRDIEFYSLCEHHILPFFGYVHIGYIPKGKIIGLSKLPRIVDHYSQRLQVQERLTNEVADCIYEVVDPIGVGVIIEANHMCMTMRGVQKQNSRTITTRLLGEFRKNAKTRNEFMLSIQGRRI